MNRIFRHTRIATALVLAATLFLASCKKDKTEAQPGEPALKLEKISQDDEYLSFVYNTDGTVKQAEVKEDQASGGAVVTYQITYDAQKHMSQLITSDNRKIVPVYVNNQLTKAQIFDVDDELVGETVYTYNGQQLKKATVSIENGSGLDNMIAFEFSYNAAGNVIKTAVSMPDVQGDLQPAGHVDYEYDNKENPLAGVSEFLKLIWHAPTKNNIIKEVQVDENLAVQETIEYTYTYNNRNYPQTGAVKKTVPGSPVENSTMQVTYK